MRSQPPEYWAARVDPTGRPISLPDTAPRGNAVLFTGPPGMGKSLELDRAEALARQQGCLTVRVDASPREPLENRFVRAIGEDLGRLRKDHGFWALRKLKKTLRELTQRHRGTRQGAEIRLGAMPVQGVLKREWNAPENDGVPSTLNELSDSIGDLAARQRRPAVLLIDNLDTASERDLAAVNELAAHLERRGRPVYLVAAGGDQAVTRLLGASRGLSGVESDIGRLYDIRECRPLTDDQIRPMLTVPLARRGILAEPAAVEALVESANGNPRRMQQLSAALGPQNLTTTVANAAIDRVNTQSRMIYQAVWNNSTDAEKDLLARAAVRGQRGLSVPSVTQAAGMDHWVGIDKARQSLVARGLVRENTNRLRFADPGLQAWVQSRVGQSAAHAGVPVPKLSQAPAPGQAGERPSRPGRPAAAQTPGLSL